MDIFTTVLTRVVPIPIKSADLKVKAVLKDAAVGELKEDLDHVENHDYYFNNDKKKQKENEKNNSAQGEQNKESAIEQETSVLKSKDKKHREHADEGVTESEDGTKHLDLYV